MNFSFRILLIYLFCCVSEENHVFISLIPCVCIILILRMILYFLSNQLFIFICLLVSLTNAA